jgi:hypothetical protein
LLFEPTGVRLHRRLEVGLTVVPVDRERRTRVGVAQRLRRGVDAGYAAELGGESVTGKVHVQSRA